MKKYLSAIVLFFSFSCFAQKKPLDYSSLDTWPEIWNEKISNDGNFIIYNIRVKSIPDSWIVQSTDNKWQRNLARASNVSITEDSRYVVYMKGRDSLIVYDPVNDVTRLVLPATSYKISPEGKGRFLLYHNNTDKSLTVADLFKNGERKFYRVGNYDISNNEEVLLIETDSLINGENKKIAKWINLVSGSEKIIATGGKQYGNFSYDKSSDQVAFTGDTTLRYYKTGMDSSIVKVNQNSTGLDSGYFLKTERPFFSADGKTIFFTVGRMPEKQKSIDNNTADVNIWYYNEKYNPAEQRLNTLNRMNFTAVISVNGTTNMQLNDRNDLPRIDLGTEGKADFGLVTTDFNYFSDDSRPGNTRSSYIVNTTTGERKLLVSHQYATVSVSPEGNFAIWYDPDKDNYFTYETSSGKQYQIASSLKGLIKLETQSTRLLPVAPYGVAGWLPGDASVLVYDKYDIWKLDPRGEKLPVNLTNEYGKRSNMMLRLWNGNKSDYDAPVFPDSTVLLVAFNLNNKDNGFYKINLNRKEDPALLTMGPYLYYAHGKFYQQFLQTPKILKAKNAPVYILRRMSEEQYPNIVFTRDFKSFTNLTHLNPEAQFNWMKTELINWKTSDGKTASGVLYKPSDFDPTKKYPLIFYIYERLSHRLHQYMAPELSIGSMSIPFFVSNGYLVFTPDIDYKKGYPGESSYNSILLAAKQLSGMSFVDASKMGIQGHSFGGYEINYFISHSNLFAAAQESSGASDFISYYNGFYRESSAQFYFEWGQGRIGTTLWKKPELFISNSPVFRAPLVQTPLLIMHNKEDGEVPFQQGAEWFNALRRSGKKVWMLQYDKEYHAINQKKNQLDFTIRMKQFFDHYLKGMSVPGWMN